MRSKREEGGERGWITIESSISGKMEFLRNGSRLSNRPRCRINEIQHPISRFSPPFKCHANLVLDQTLSSHVNKIIGTRARAREREREREREGGRGRTEAGYSFTRADVKIPVVGVQRSKERTILPRRLRGSHGVTRARHYALNYSTRKHFCNVPRSIFISATLV